MCMLTGERVQCRFPESGQVAFRLVRVQRLPGSKKEKYTSLYTQFKHGGYDAEYVKYRIGTKYKSMNCDWILYDTLGKPKADYPLADNTAGFYAFATYEQALTALRKMNRRRPSTLLDPDGMISLARVRLFGRGVRHGNTGFRGEYMTIETIVCGRRIKE